jgi:hydroxymethylpyrimidine/phosphomethylpyrimidine kinase
LSDDAIATYRERLVARAALITPNLDEAAVLLERERPIAADELYEVADQLYRRFGCPVLLKGGHLDTDPVDVLRHSGGAVGWRHARVAAVDSHGTGCMLSAAIAGHLALGCELERACELSLGFVHDALVQSCRLRGGISLAGIEAASAELAHLQRVER